MIQLKKLSAEESLRSKEKETAFNDALVDIRNFLSVNLTAHILPMFKTIWVDGLKREGQKPPVIDRMKALQIAPDEVVSWLCENSRLRDITENPSDLKRRISRNNGDIKAIVSGTDFTGSIQAAYINTSAYNTVTSDEVTGILEMLDVVGLLKICRYSSEQDAIYESVVSDYPGLERGRWNGQLADGINTRNTYSGHSSSTSYARVSSRILIDRLNNLLDICKEVAGDARVKAYKKIESSVRAKERRFDFQLIPIADIIQKIESKTKRNLDENTLRTMLGHDLFSSKILDDKVWCENEDQIVSFIDMTLNLQSDEVLHEKYETSRQQQKEKSELGRKYRTDKTKTLDAAVQELIRKQRPLRNITAGAKLSGQTLEELLDTHEIILTKSMLTGRKGRDVVIQLANMAAEKRYTGKNAHISILMNTKAELFAGRRQYKIAEAHMRACEWDSKEAEKWSLEKKKYQDEKTAYYLMEDILSDAEIIRFQGQYDPYGDENDAIIRYVQDNPFRRICVMSTRDAAAIYKLLQSNACSPLCTVAKLTVPISLGNKTAVNTRLNIMQGDRRLIDNASTKEAADLIISTCGKDRILQSIGVDGADAENDNADLKNNNDVAHRHTNNAGNTDITETNTTTITRNVKSQDPETRPGMGKQNRKSKTGKNGTTYEDVTEKRVVNTNIGPSWIQYKMENEREIYLTQKLKRNEEDAEGGEGAIYETNIADTVAKIFHDGQNTENREKKLRAMIKEDVAALNEHGILWPEHVLYDANGVFRGYIMKKAPAYTETLGQSVMQITNPGSSVAGWTRKQLVQTAYNLADKLAFLHKKGILMGDVNENNIMINPGDATEMYLVDCDSYQYKKYTCPVGRMEYTHPKALAGMDTGTALSFEKLYRTEEQEDYALAIVIFQILMCGQHPFATKAGIGANNYAANMRDRHFAYGEKNPTDIPDGSWMIWKNLTDDINNAFIDAFGVWQWVKAKEWAVLTKAYISCIENRNYSDEIMPKLYHEENPNRPWYRYGRCPLCGEEFNFPPIDKKIEMYDKGTLYCGNCFGMVKYLHTIISENEVTCSKCKKKYHPHADSVHIHQRLGSEYICDACMKKKIISCACCGTNIEKPEYEMRKIIQTGSLCYSCSQKEHVNVRCNDCGKLVENVETLQYVKTFKINGAYYCNDCYRKKHTKKDYKAERIKKINGYKRRT